MAIKAVAFDVGNVLLRLHYDQMVESLAATGGGNVDALGETMQQLLRDYDEQASLYAEFELGGILAPEFIRRFSELTGLAIAPDAFQDPWNELFTENAGIKGIVTRLAEKLPLVLLSNTNPLHADRFLVDFEVMRHFKHRVFSYRVGAMKPDERIYRAALSELDLQPPQLFFVEDREMNIAGAQAVGIKTFHYSFNDDKLAEALRKEGLTV